MKLSYIYSDQPFKEVKFKNGFNVILGKVTKPSDKSKDSHNLGKTTLIYVIDFMLLKDFGEGQFLYDFKEKFLEYTFYLEILLNNGAYLTIKRSVKTNTKISFKIHGSHYQDYRNETKWDHYELTLKKAKQTLNDYLNFNVLTNYNYRKVVSYFLRTQDDYLDVFQLNKYSNSKHVDWKPLLFEMLGFNGKYLTDKYDIDEEIENLKTFIGNIEKKTDTNSEEVDKIKGLIELKEEEKINIRKYVDDFKFYKEELKLNTDLVDRIERKISKLNTWRYNLEFEIDQINSSMSNKIDFDMDQIETLFKEVKIYFPDALKKSYSNLVEFNKQLYEERSKHLEERLKQVKEQYKNIQHELEKMDDKRSQILSVLKDENSFSKYKHYQEQLINVEAELVNLKNQLKGVNEINSLNDAITTLEEKNDKIKNEIKKHIVGNENKIYPLIRRNFNQIVKNIIYSPALISLKINQQGNIEFDASIQNSDQTTITAKGKGTTYRKFLCMAFDLSILIAYNERSFFKFVYHDGAFEALDDRKKINFIKTARDICKKYDLQYILTTIEDDLPRDEHDNVINFDKDELALTLSDEGDEGRLFEMSF